MEFGEFTIAYEDVIYITSNVSWSSKDGHFDSSFVSSAKAEEFLKLTQEIGCEINEVDRISTDLLFDNDFLVMMNDDGTAVISSFVMNHHDND